MDEGTQPRTVAGGRDDLSTYAGGVFMDIAVRIPAIETVHSSAGQCGRSEHAGGSRLLEVSYGASTGTKEAAGSEGLRPMTVRKAIIASAVAIAAGGALTAVEHRVLRGYWRRPASVVAGMKADRLQAVCRLTESNRGELEPAAGVVDLAGLCGTSGVRSCVEGETILELLGKNPLPASIGEIDRAVWPPLWTAVRTHNQSAGLGTPASGTAVQFTSGGRTYEWVKYSTHELEDDWYRAVQVLYAFTGNQPELVRWSSYRYEIAGLEDTPMWLLWVVNAVVFAIACVIRTTEGRGATQRHSRIWKAVGSGALLLSGSAFGLVALSGVQQHDPWLVVLLITATLMIMSGAYIAMRSGTHGTPTRKRSGISRAEGG